MTQRAIIEQQAKAITMMCAALNVPITASILCWNKECTMARDMIERESAGY